MKSRKVPISYNQLKKYCTEYKKTEGSEDLNCRGKAFDLFNDLVNVGFLTRSGDKVEDLSNNLLVYTVVHSFSGDRTIFTPKDFESYASGIGGQANIVGVYFDVSSAVSATSMVVMEAVGRENIQGRFDVKNVDKVIPQLERNNNFVFGKISNAGTIEYFTIHKNIVARETQKAKDLRVIFNEGGMVTADTTYKSRNLNKIIDDQLFEFAKEFSSPNSVQDKAAVFYAPISDTFYFSLTGKKINKKRRMTYIYIVKINGEVNTIIEKSQQPSTPEEDLKKLRQDIEPDVFEI